MNDTACTSEVFLNTPIQVEDSWLKILENFARTGGVLMTLGDIDTGKSTFSRWICSEIVSLGGKPALIDADTGQPDCGPPGCISFVRFDKHPLCFTPNHNDGLHFIGSLTPVGHLLQSLTGIMKLYGKALAMGCTHFVVNTTGWIDGGGAVAYKQAKIDSLMPRIIAAFEKERELHPFLSPFRRLNTIKIFRIPIASAVKQRTREIRKKNRDELFREYFSRNILIALKTDLLGISGVPARLTNEQVRNQVVSLMDDTGIGKALGITRQYYPKERILEISTPYNENPRNIKRIHYAGFYLDPQITDLLQVDT